jgi:prolipoprotein diacylglyceryltransferase
VWRLWDQRRKPVLLPGGLLGLYLIAPSIERFEMEFLSINPRMAFGFPEAQWVSVVLLAAGCIFFLQAIPYPVVSDWQSRTE